VEPEVRYERRGAVVIITLNRPDRRNALNIATCQQLRRAWTQVESDPDARVAVVTGSGDRAFCAGYDIAEKRSGAPLTLRDFAPRHGTTLSVTKPVIAAVNGAAVAAGMALVEACDLVVAAEGAWFSLPEAKLGLGVAPFVQSLWTLPQRIVMELALTGEPLTARRAYELGFVNRLVPPARLLDEAVTLAAGVAANAPLVVHAGKAMIYRGIEAMGMPAALDAANTLFGPVNRSEDAEEGFRAMAERRPPQWKGR
jgi:enoyl-CoA hydratase/carnithine racemase